ncbi:putative P6 [Cytorhabdovirus tiliae]|uniref:P6 n=1 Tax=Cytorhabdovirus sp. 'tiliae' TaxID=3004219 RepID=A0A9J7CGU9_9RHAB|nr:putative P6 [Cytorhabdovirus tiliae]
MVSVPEIICFLIVIPLVILNNLIEDLIIILNLISISIYTIIYLLDASNHVDLVTRFINGRIARRAAYSNL